MIYFLRLLTFLLLIMTLPVLAFAQRALPRALYITQPDVGVPGFSEHASSLELIWNNNGSRQAFVNFLRKEYEDFSVQYTCVYLMVETDLLTTDGYREHLSGLLGFFRKNGVNRVEALYYPSDGLHNYSGGVSEFADAIHRFNRQADEADKQFDAMHFFLMPNRYAAFKSFENRHSRANQELFNHILGEMEQARAAAAGMEIVVTVDADSFFGVGETIVYSTGKSFGNSISAMADKVTVMNYRDFSNGSRRAGDGSQTAGLLLNIRPVLLVLGRENKRAAMAVNAAPYRHPRLGNISGFSRIPGYRDGNSGRRELNRQLRRVERNLSSAERGSLDYMAIFYYGAYLGMGN